MLEFSYKLSNCPPFQSLVLCFGRISREGSTADAEISEALDNIAVSNSSKNVLCYEDDTSCQSLRSYYFYNFSKRLSLSLWTSPGTQLQHIKGHVLKNKKPHSAHNLGFLFLSFLS